MMYDTTFIDASLAYNAFEPPVPLEMAQPATTESQVKKDRLTAIAVTAVLSLVSGAVMTTLALGSNQAIAGDTQAPSQALTQQQMAQWMADKTF